MAKPTISKSPFPFSTVFQQHILDGCLAQEIALVERIMNPSYTITEYKGLYELAVDGIRLHHFYLRSSEARAVAERYLRMKAAKLLEDAFAVLDEYGDAAPDNIPDDCKRALDRARALRDEVSRG